MRRISIVFVILLLLCLDGFGQLKNGVVEFTKISGSHNVKLVFETKPFVVKAHKIEEVTDERAPVRGTIIDGRYALGTDLSVPKVRIATVKLFFDGKEVPVNRMLFSDCYNPNLEKDYFWLKFSDDRKSVMVFMAGGDGAGGYQVFWIFRSDGKHSRFSSAVSDANYPDFVKWFFDIE